MADIRFAYVCPAAELCAMEARNEERKEWAKLLYTRHDVNIRDIAAQTGADEGCVRKWIQEGNWNGLKRSLLTSKEEQLGCLYDILGQLSARIKEQQEGNTKNADLLIKYTTAIKNLETETSISQIIEVAAQFIDWLQPQNPELAKTVALLFDSFIKKRLEPQ